VRSVDEEGFRPHLGELGGAHHVASLGTRAQLRRRCWPRGCVQMPGRSRSPHPQAAHNTSRVRIEPCEPRGDSRSDAAEADLANYARLYETLIRATSKLQTTSYLVYWGKPTRSCRTCSAAWAPRAAAGAHVTQQRGRRPHAERHTPRHKY
jgi:hypothetical protein